MASGVGHSSLETTTVALSTDASTLVYGSPGDSDGGGAAWVFSVANCNYTLSPLTQTFSFGPQSGSVGVTAPAGCPWNALTGPNSNWITITSGASGSGNGTLGFSVSQNTGQARTGTILIGGFTVTIQQEDGCVFQLQPLSGVTGAAGTSVVNALGIRNDNPQTVNVQDLTGPSCTWTASTSTSWIHIRSMTGSPGSGTVSYSVDLNLPSGLSTAPQAGATVPKRTGTITLIDYNNASIGEPPTTAAVFSIAQDGSVGIDGVEVTQAVQVYQTLDALENTSGGNFNFSPVHPPVPIVAGKPAAVRVMMQQSSADTLARIKVTGCGSGSTLGLTIEPQCTPQTARSETAGCHALSFFCTPTPNDSGNWPITIDSLDANDVSILNKAITLTFPLQTTNPLTLKGVSVCAGHGACSQAAALSNIATLAQKILPVPSVDTVWTDAVVAQQFDPNQDAGFWDSVAVQVANQWSFSPNNSTTVYAGAVPAASVQGTLYSGAVHSSPAHGFAAIASEPVGDPLEYDAAPEIAAYFLNQALGRHQTNVSLPSYNAGAGYGCSPALPDPSTDWPFTDNLLHYQASDSGEVGYDVVAQKPVLPSQYFDVMDGICTKRWISPFTYNALLSAFTNGSFTPSSAHPLVTAPTSNLFWTVAGTISGNLAVLAPLFVVNNSQASTGAGSGSWQIQVQDGSGHALFSRSFTPATPAFLANPAAPLGLPQNFSELIPVTAGGNRIVVFNNSNAPIGSVQFGGAAPTPHLTSALAGTISGMQNVTWSITDPDSTTFTSRVFYSADNGSTWAEQGEGAITALPVDFDALPGSAGASLIRVDVSDGVNMGSSVSAPFSVARKQPKSPVILSPADDSVFAPSQLVQLSASIYDADDGLLTGPAVTWRSSLAGALGTGAVLNVYTLPAGMQTITVKGTDSDGNSVAASVTITIAGAPPAIHLTFTGLSNTPVSCVQATITASAGSVPLAGAQYSFNGGSTFASIPAAELPATIAVPGTGAINFIARVFDAAGQLASSDASFAIAVACAPPVVLSANPPSITFQNVAGGVAPPSISLSVGASGSVAFGAAASSTGHWLEVAEPAGPAPQTLSVSANPSGLSDGSYSGTVVLTPLNGGAILNVPVTLTITGGCTISLPTSSASQPVGGGNGSFNVNASSPECPWAATSLAGWLSITSGSSGTGNGTVSFSAAVNESGIPRAGAITVAGQTFVVSQLGIGSSFSLNPTSANVAASAGTGSVAVTATPPTATWTAVSNAAWIGITSGAAGTGNGTVQYSFSANLVASPRSGTLTIAGQTFTLTQAAAASLGINKTHSGSFAPGQQNASYTITVSNSAAAGPTYSSVTVTDRVPAGLTLVSMSGTGWTCTNNSCSRSDTLSPGADYPAITVTVNVAADAPAQVINQASVSGGGAAGASANDPTTISATACSITLSAPGVSLPPTGTSTAESCPVNSGQPDCGVAPELPATLTVTPTAGCGAWTATSSNPQFLRIVSDANGSGAGTVRFTLLNNTHQSQQNYTITVSSGSVSQSYAVTEAGSGDSQVFREVYALYEQLLGRDPDGAGFAFWTGSGGAGLGQMADSFLTSPEAFNTDFVAMAIYQAATGAPPTYAQFIAAVTGLRSGVQTAPGLFNWLTGSGYAASNLYQNLLNRAPTAADSSCIASGLSACFQTIIGYPTNVTPVGSANNEFQSTGSFHTDHSNALYVQTVYYVTVSRDPDPAGLAFWVGVANTGGPGLLFQGTSGYPTRIQILGPGTPNQGFIGSPEFQGLFAN